MSAVTPQRERRSEHQQEPAPQPPAAPPPRRFPWGLAVLVAIIAIGIFVPGWLSGLIPGIPNPFEAKTVDRSGPAVLKSIRDLQELRAASGHYEVIVDLEKDTRLPSSILGERILFVAVGDVDATVDLGELSDDDVQISADRRRATITLPRPQVGDARLDLRRSYVYDRQRGVLNGVVGEDTDDREVYLAAQRKLNEAARNGSGLVPRAEQNTRRTLESLLGSLGFTEVTVRFEPQT